MYRQTMNVQTMRMMMNVHTWILSSAVSLDETDDENNDEQEEDGTQHADEPTGCCDVLNHCLCNHTPGYCE